MQDPAITTVIPLYNGAEFIKEALDSVLAQTLPPAKIIVVDDGSIDAGPDIVARVAKNHDISLIRKENGGQSSARNLGVAYARTPLIALLDQDDIWYPHHLEELIKPFRQTRYPELGWVYSNLDEIDREGHMIVRACLNTASTIEHPKRTLIGCLATDMFILPTSSLINRRAFDLVGGFDERLSGYEDDDLFLRMFRQGFDNVYLKDALAKWRIFSGSTSYTPRMSRSRMIYLHKLLRTFPSDDWRGTSYARDLLTPRFFPSLLKEYRDAVRQGDLHAVRTAVDDLKVLVPFLPRRSRAVMRALLPIMVHKTPATMATTLLDWDPPLIRKLLRLALPERRARNNIAASNTNPAPQDDP
jgi:glycosyltransferase involved in cell wall biosynthesis